MNELDHSKLPRHLAIIMDGNGRWAKAQGKSRLEGHQVGAESVRHVSRVCRELGIPYLTMYALSTENWKRPKLEVEGLMRLLGHYLRHDITELMDNGIRLNAIGDLDRLPSGERKLLDRAMKQTGANDGMFLTLALSYGGREEIASACRRLAEDVLAGRIKAEEIDEKRVSEKLYTAGLPDPDLLIRTGGEHRVSNFLLWQIAYSELYITDTQWPDFRKDELIQALLDYQTRQRRFGLTGDQIARQVT